MILLLDNGTTKDDKLSYTNHIVKSLNQQKITYLKVNTIRNIDKILHKIKGIIITGSSLKLSKLSKTGHFDKYSFNMYYISRLNVPIYGICFGCQLLNIIYGGELKDNKKYLCDDYDFYKYNPNCPLFNGSTHVNYTYCFSDLVIPNKKMGVTVFSSTQIDGKLLDTGFEFEKGRVFGSLFHPECRRDTEFVYSNFYEFCKKYIPV